MRFYYQNSYLRMTDSECLEDNLNRISVSILAPAPSWLSRNTSRSHQHVLGKVLLAFSPCTHFIFLNIFLGAVDLTMWFIGLTPDEFSHARIKKHFLTKLPIGKLLKQRRTRRSRSGKRGAWRKENQTKLQLFYLSWLREQLLYTGRDMIMTWFCSLNILEYGLSQLCH